MRTGFDLTGSNEGLETQYLQSMVNIIQPVMEEAIFLASQYCKACNRSVLLDGDIEYALKYCVMHRVGVNLGSILPETEEDEEGEEEDLELVDEEDCPTFTRYSGKEEIFLKINKAHDDWKNWNPDVPIQQYLKKCIDNNDLEFNETVSDSDGVESE